MNREYLGNFKMDHTHPLKELFLLKRHAHQQISQNPLEYHQGREP